MNEKRTINRLSVGVLENGSTTAMNILLPIHALIEKEKKWIVLQCVTLNLLEPLRILQTKL